MFFSTSMPFTGLSFLLLLQHLGASSYAASIASPACQDKGRTNQTIRWVDCHDRVPEPIEPVLNITGSTFVGDLPPNLFCGEMDVPMDYSKPFNAKHNNITIGFAMTRPSKRASGLVIYHAGGPGENAAAQIWASALNLSASFEGLEDFDVLAVNMRGIQFSNPLNLSSGVFFDGIPAFPSNEEEFKQYQAAMTKFYDAAIRDSTPSGIMEHVSSAEMVEDWESVRRALGYEKVNYAGVSYGTFVGLSYATSHPEVVDRFVLDAAIPHGMSFQDMVKFQVAAANRVLQRADAFCLNDTSCPFYGQGNGSVIKAWEAVLAQAEKSPIPAPSCLSNSTEIPCISPVTPTDLRRNLDLLLRSESGFSLFNLALNQSLNGDASGIAYAPATDIRETVVSPLLCSDTKIDESIKTWDGFNNLTLNAKREGLDPFNIIYSQIWQLGLQCSVWPFDTAERTTLPTDLPIMWMTSDFDLNLPTELTTFSWQQAPNSTLVIRHGDEHTSILMPAPADAAGNVAREFIRTGVMPGVRDDAEVTIIAPGGERPPVPGAYEVPTGAIAGDF
ncbi:Alpha/Beta hydrolase protein [Favolaschia claudopus]|uniref:Alpha/Beta hydrolase protein n=1 Tax=Favolaschia claudopus TaxID=2862362 RepID=A0AAW0CXQ2_9AGAR